jgi:hypothetical protein
MPALACNCKNHYVPKYHMTQRSCSLWHQTYQSSFGLNFLEEHSHSCTVILLALTSSHSCTMYGSSFYLSMVFCNYFPSCTVHPVYKKKWWHRYKGLHCTASFSKHCSVVNVWGKCFKMPQQTHESFLTIDHSCKIFFWYLPNWTSTNLWCVVL